MLRRAILTALIATMSIGIHSVLIDWEILGLGLNVNAFVVSSGILYLVMERLFPERTSIEHRAFVLSLLPLTAMLLLAPFSPEGGEVAILAFKMYVTGTFFTYVYLIFSSGCLKAVQ